MADFLDYLKWRGDLSFDESPFCQVDALLLCQLSYLNFDGILGSSFGDGISLDVLAEEFRSSPDFQTRSYMGMVINSRTPELLAECGRSRRFSSVVVCGYVPVLDSGREEQFCAMTFRVGRNVSAVVFRGTDDTLAGWKEDFNISYMEQIPSQADALGYFVRAASELRGKFICAGHSKGGNVALYAAVLCPRRIQDRIISVYNFDGPGFPTEFFRGDGFLRLADRLHSFYPEFSIVGMIFSHYERYTVVRSSEFAIMQHDAFSWQIEGAALVAAGDFTDESKFFYKTFNGWVTDISRDDRKRFVDALFAVLYASDARTNTELDEDKLRASAKMLRAMKELDPETRDSVRAILRLLVRVAKSNLPIVNVLGGLFPASKK